MPVLLSANIDADVGTNIDTNIDVDAPPRCTHMQTRMQVLPVPASVTLTAATRHVHETLGSAMRTFVSTEGVRGLWRGIASVFISAG